MEFVNSIAKIVHMEVSLHGGAPNKNIGDAFLLVWRLPKGVTAQDIPRPGAVLPAARSGLGASTAARPRRFSGPPALLTKEAAAAASPAPDSGESLTLAEKSTCRLHECRKLSDSHRSGHSVSMKPCPHICI